MKRENKIKVFLSYSRSSNEIAKELKEKLNKQNFIVWKDTVRIQGGQDWRSEIDAAIHKSQAIIVLITDESMKSHYVTYEWAFALGLDKKVIPILFEDVQIHPRLDILQSFNFIKDKKNYRQLFSALKTPLKKKKTKKFINKVVVNG